MSGGGLSNFLGGPFGSQGAPGFVPPAASAAIGPALGQSETMMANRYNQLGLGGPGAAGGTQTPMGTPEAMDLGLAPSVTGGIPGQFAAVGGELQNQALAGGPLGANKSAGNQIGSIGNFLGRK
jgi:hypothetical protein